jgi:hypothetical protein
LAAAVIPVAAIMPQAPRSGKPRPGCGIDRAVLYIPQSGRCEPDRNMLDWSMPKTKQPGSEAKKKGGFVIGRDNFGKISAVEGIRLTPAMKKRADDAKRKGLSAEEYRQTIVRSYRKA